MSVTLDRVFVHNDADHADYVALPVGAEVETVQVRSNRVTYAGGRHVHINVPGATSDILVTVPLATRAQVDDLRSRAVAKQRVMVRDTRGRVVWGRLFVDQITEARAPHDVVNLVLQVEQSGAQTAEV